jgi:cell division protein FtsI/penicillin-binding protein 2
MSDALVRSSNTYFLALEDQLRSVEGPVQMAERMGLFQFNDPGLPQQIIDDNRSRSPSGRSRPARWPWPARTPRWPPTAPGAPRRP